MPDFETKIVTDENMRPIAVQLSYEDWIRIAKLLGLNDGPKPNDDVSRFSGTLKWGEDAVAYQRRVREEWQR